MSKQKPSIGLIIQGPMLSFGLTGHSANLADARGDDLVNFDCLNNIRETLDHFGELLSCCCLATWKRPSPIDIPGIDVLQFEDKTPTVLRGKKQIATSMSNKYRQFFLCHQGAKHLYSNYRPDYIVKIRTDQFLDLKLLREFITSYHGSPKASNSHIFISSIDRNLINIQDFYFAGPSETMIRFFDSIISHEYFEFVRRVQIEIPLKFAYNNLYKEIAVPGYGYFPGPILDAPPYQTGKILLYLHQHIFRPLPMNLYETLSWRGEPMAEAFNRRKRLTCWYADDLPGFEAPSEKPQWVIQDKPPLFHSLSAYNYRRWLSFQKRRYSC